MKSRKPILASVTLLLLFLSSSIIAQVGINTATPDASAELDVSSKTRGFLPPRLTTLERDAIALPAHDLMVFNLETNTLDINMSADPNNPDWQSITPFTSRSSAPMIASLDNCDTPHIVGVLEEGVNASSISLSIDYTGGNGEAFLEEVISATGVSGNLTATRASGNLENGLGSVTYRLDGIATSSGTAQFSIDLAGQSCTIAIPVRRPFTVPSSISIAEDQKHFSISVFDEDYLPYTVPTTAAHTGSLSPGTNEPNTIDIPGLVTTSGMSIQIPVVTSGSGQLPAFSQTINVPSHLTEDGNSRDVNLRWTSQSYDNNTTHIAATLASVGAPLKIKKLDINAGLGADYQGIALAQFNFPYNQAGDTTTYTWRVIPGIPDRHFGNGTHDFLYQPITNQTTGKTWLNNNLGAHYANINHSNFNPTQQANTATDYNAYGSLYQWGRQSDGHELINWTSSTATDNTEQSRETTARSRNESVGHNQFITTKNGQRKWYSGNNASSFWQNTAGMNYVCPAGYRIPTKTELDEERNSWSSNDQLGAKSGKLQLPSPGYRNFNFGEIEDAGNSGRYWSSTTRNNDSGSLIFDNNSAYTSNDFRSIGFSVRCIKD